jgi:hypothetical protein
MKPLDDFIKSNPDRFDTEEPLSGHFDRFDERLNKTKGRETIKGWSMVLKIAAALILGLVLTYAVIRESGIAYRGLDYIASAAELRELREAERYYTRQVDMYYSKIENLRFENDKAQKQLILDELSDLDRQVISLKHDLMLNPEDERVVHAIISNYQIKLEFMDMIVTRTQESNFTIL